MKALNGGVRFALIVAVISILGMICGCAKTTIKHSYMLGQTFTELEHYTWIPSSTQIQVGKDPIVDANVHFIADQELKLKGFDKSPQNPDFVISMTYDYTIDSSADSYQLRMLTLKVYRPKTKLLLWRGTAYGTINVDLATDDLKKAVKAILSNFPPLPGEVPDDVLLADRGFQSLVQGDYDLAEKYLNRALSEYPNNPYAILNLGVVYQNTGRAEMARRTYEKLITLNPSAIAGAGSQSDVEGKSLVDIAKENLKKIK